MKTLKYTTLLIALSVLVGSCAEDFLDLTPPSNANEEEFYRNEAEIQTAMVSAYSTLHTIYGSLNVMYFVGALSSDDAYTTDQGTGAYEQFQNVQVRANNTEVLNAWQQFYTAITRINKVIETTEQLDSQNKNEYAAEMKFLRALYYFNMTQIWGSVPLVTETMSIDEAYAKGRATTDQLYAQIIEDLQFCIQHLDQKTDVRAVGVPAQGAAYALLGKVYLTMGDKAKAASSLMNIYGAYQLTPDYADLWDLNQKNGVESIFEIQYLGGAENAPSTYWALYSPNNNLGAITLQGGGHNQVTEDLWNAYEEGDPRRDISIQDGWMTNAGVFDPTRFPIKWVDHTKSYVGKREASDNNFIVLRYADVLLMLAEATGEAKYLNEVRARAGLQLYGTAAYPSDRYPTFDLAVEHERHVELAMEFHRFFDLKRTGRALEVLKASDKNKNGLLDNLTENNLVWPIPETVIDQNPDFWTPQQNPGY
ncbi:MAG: RagB/SusD family nutrient uptake outer membrane protein [Mangrovibacterium sp.]